MVQMQQPSPSTVIYIYFRQAKEFMIPDLAKLPLEFNPVRLLQDLKQIPSTLWIEHFNASDYEGGWSALALYSPTGSSSFILPMMTDNFQFLETPILLKCPYKYWYGSRHIHHP